MKALPFPKLIGILSLLCLGWTSTCFQLPLAAQSHLLQYRTLMPSDGLAGSTVHCIEQDDEGFIWLTTSEGIQQYDGYRFRTLTQATHGLRAYNYQKIINVCGLIWAIQWQANYLVDIIDPLTLTVRPFEEVFPEAPLKIVDVAGALTGPNHSIFLKTKSGEVYQYDGRFRRIGSKEQGFSNAVFPGDSTIWLVNDQTWCEYSTGTNKVNRCDNLDFALEVVKCCLPDGLFLVAQYNSGASQRFWFKKWRHKPQPEYQSDGGAPVSLKSCTEMNIDRQKRFWLCCESTIDVLESASGRKIVQLNTAAIREKTGHEVNFYSIARAFFDRNNLAWLPTNQGLLIVSVVDNHFQPFLNGQSTSVRGMAAIDSHRVVVATYKGVKMIDVNRPGQSLGLDAPLYSPVGILYEAPQVWMATHEFSLVRYNMIDRRSHRYFFPQQEGKNVYYAGLSCFRDAAKRLWVGTEKGLLWLDEARDTLINWLPLSALFGAGDLMLDVRHLIENKEGMWIVTSRGLFLKKPASDVVTPVEQFAGQNFYHLYIDAENVFWLATRGGGVVQWDRKTNSTKRFTTAQGLSNNTVYAIYEDQNGYLWMSTNVGLNVLDKKTGTIQVFMTRDGLSNNEFNFASHLRMPDGRFLFGGLDGVVSFYPENLKKTQSLDIAMQLWAIQRINPKSSRLTDLLADFKQKGQVRIPYAENNLYIEFALLDFFDPASNRFAYLLEGISPDWQFINESYLRLNSLPYGNYKLHIRGFGKAGAASLQELVIPLSVEAPIYVKPWFWALVFIGLLGLFRLRTRRLRYAKRHLERLVDERTAHIEAQKEELEKLNITKDQLFAIIGHELRSPVMQLQDFSEKVDYLVKKGDTSRLKMISNHFGQTIANVREIVENLLSWGKMQSGRQVFRPQYFELQQVTNDIFRHTIQLAEIKDIRLELEEQASLMLYADPNAVGIILRNLLHNAMKFTPQGGAVTFRAAQLNMKSVVVEITDSGMGMDENTLALVNAGQPQESRSGTGGERGTGLGLSVCKQLAQQNHAVLEFRSEIGTGTTARIVFPAEIS